MVILHNYELQAHKISVAIIYLAFPKAQVLKIFIWLSPKLQ